MPETLVWKDPACPVRVEYSPSAIENIRRLAVDGLLSLPRVGLGIGGLLLGTRQAGTVTILDVHPIPCSYASGPSFAPSLGEIEQGRISARKNTAESNEILGYYCSRPRLPVQITEKDRTLFAYLCPGAGQIALIVRPSTTELSRAGLFYRKKDGVLSGGSVLPIEEFEIAEAVTAADDSVTAPLQSRLSRDVEEAVIGATTRLFGDPDPLSIPNFVLGTSRRRLPWTALVAPLLVVAILVAMFMTREQWLPRPPLELRTAETEGHFAVEWNRAAVRGLDHAVLTIVDGGATKKILLDMALLQAGTVPYSRQTPDVTANLDAGSIHASAKFVAPPAPARPVPPAGADPASDPASAAPSSHP